MTGIDMSPRSVCFALLGVIACFTELLGSAYAQSPAGLSVLVINGLNTEQVTVLGAQGDHSRSQWLRLYRLTDPAPIGLECCLVAKAPVAKKNSPEYVATGAFPLTFRGVAAQPFVGIAFADGDAVVRRIGPQNVEVLAKRGAPPVRVHHCVSQEGMRIDVEQDLNRQTYYVPLGMDVDAPKEYRCDLRL